MNKSINIEQLKISCSQCSLNELCFPHGMNEEGINELDKVVDRCSSDKVGDYLYRDGDVCNAIYAVRSGSIKTTKQNAAGEVQIVGFHLPGELLGFDGFATDQHGCSAQFLETSSVCKLPLNSLESLCHTIPSLQNQMRRIMGLEVKNDHELLLMLGKMSADEKLATFFLNISSRMKQRNWKELEFNLSMPRQDIANYLGLAVETVSRLMTQFHDKGLIEVDKRNIKINDIDKLKGIVSNCQGGAG